MEETLQENVRAEVKVHDEDQGGTGRRLRDRDLLRKRKAEAEERATNQWVYGAQSSKRAKRETNNVPKKKGRPRKNVPVKEQQPETTEVQDAGEIETPSQAEEMVTAPHSDPVSTLDSASIPAQVSAPALDLPQISAAVSVPIPLPAPEMKPSSEPLLQEVLIEDLGSDEEEDKAVPQDKLVLDQDGAEEPSAIAVAEQNKVFSDTVLTSPQPDSLPGNLI
ncbi:hemogen isoform X1 [Ictalurus furcatus]|uniref:hemogen isoform X1 n=1 Tax=Ictalurus furcatus TaxID=66913 RepID=UPI0023503878|nr:hemogen isoform X1 [Ictalurus furcatus]